MSDNLPDTDLPLQDWRLPCGMVVRELDEPERVTRLEREAERADADDDCSDIGDRFE